MNTIYVAPVLLNISIICADRKEQTFIDLKHYNIQELFRIWQAYTGY